MLHSFKVVSRGVAAAVIALCVTGAHAGDNSSYPDRPIRLIVPFAPGGAVDITARIMSKKVSQDIGQSIIVENYAGASGSIGTNLVAKAKPDGYTLAITSASLTANPSLYKSLPYDTLRDLTPVTLLISFPLTLAVNPSLHVNSLQQFLLLAKAQPGALSFASSGIGGTAHLDGEILNSAAGIHMVHVPYKGGAPAVSDTVAGYVPAILNTIPALLPYLQDGKLIPLAVTSEKRTPLLPNVPTFAESGLPMVNLSEWSGILAPANTPPEIVAKIRDEYVKALQDPEVGKRISGLGGDLIESTPDEFSAFIKSGIVTQKQIIEKSGAKL